MEIWLDTAELNIVMRAAKKGMIKGITTNPSILAKVKHLSSVLLELLQLQEGPIAIQVTSSSAPEMVEEGRHIAAFSDRMIVKIPVTKEGLIAMRTLQREGISILATGIFEESQVLLAANVGVTFVTPYFSHIAQQKNPIDVLMNMQSILTKGNYASKLLVASVKELNDLIFLATLGAFAATIKEDLYTKLIAHHPHQEEALAKQLSDWGKTHGDLSIKEVLTH